MLRWLLGARGAVRPVVLVSGGVAASAVVVVIAISVPGGGGGACNVNATTANFAAQIAATNPGQTLCLASGNYGSWSGVNKASPGITIKEAPGATATLANLNFAAGPGVTIGWFTLDGIDYQGGNLCAAAHDITIENATQTGQFVVNAGAGPGANNACTSGPQMVNANFAWDNMRFTLSDCPTGSCLGPEGRLSFAYGSTAGAGITVRNSTFTGNCADGIQFYGNGDAGRGVLVKGNEFVNLLQGSCAPHIDGVQFVGGGNVTFDGNWFHNSEHGIVDYDGNADNTIITNNVFDTNSDSVCLGGAANPTIEHNTFIKGIMTLCVNHSGTPTTGVVWRNNIQNGAPNIQGASSYGSGSPNHDLCLSGTCSGIGSLNGTPTWAGGATPTTYAGFALSGGSLGKGAASDGSDIGVNP